MWRKLVEEVRSAGPRKIAIIAVVAAIAVLFAYGVNSTNDAANGRTLPRASQAGVLQKAASVPLTPPQNRLAGALR